MCSKWGYEDKLKFFWKEILVKKRQNRIKVSSSLLLSSFCERKTVAFVVYSLLISILLISFQFCVFRVAEIILKKIWVCHDKLIYCTTYMSPTSLTPTSYWELFSINLSTNFFYHICLFLSVCNYFFFCVRTSPYLSEPIFICMHLFLSVKVSSFSWSSFRISSSLLWESLHIHDHLWESLLLYDHLWESLLIYDHIWESLIWTPSSKKIFYHQNKNDISIISYVSILCFFFTLNSSHFVPCYLSVYAHIFIRLEWNIHSLCCVRFFVTLWKNTLHSF